MPLTSGRFQSHGKPPGRSSPPDAKFTKEIRACKGIRPFASGEDYDQWLGLMSLRRAQAARSLRR